MLIVYGSLYPWHFVAQDLTDSPLGILLTSWHFALNRFMIRDVLVNVALYAPAGLTGHLAFRKYRRPGLAFAAPVVISAIVSASVEMAQIFDPTRECSALDLATNVLGALIGVILAIVLEDVYLVGRTPRRSRKPPDRSALSLLVCWVVWLLFPLFPVMGRAMLSRKLALFAQSSLVDPLPFASAALCWFAAGSLFRAAGLRPARRFTAISVALIPAQFFIVDRQPLLSELAGAVVGAAFFALSWSKRNAYKRALAWIFLGLIVVRGLDPFHFLPAVVRFSWIPFGGFLAMNWQTGAQLIAEKFFWYGAAIWLMLASGIRCLAATTMVFLTLFAIEIAQTHLPGRTAEITDPLLAIFAGYVVSTLRRPAYTSEQASTGNSTTA